MLDITNGCRYNLKETSIMNFFGTEITMKRFLKILLPILLSIAIIAGICWFFFSYDKGLTQDLLRSCGSFFAGQNNMKAASWFYELAYNQNYDRDNVAIEVADKYIQIGNYTKAEAALYKAIEDGADVPVYIALSKAYVAQDKLYDAVELLDSVTDPQIKQKLDEIRPPRPTSPNEQTTYHEIISVTVEAAENKLYVNPNGEYPSVAIHAYNAPVTLTEGENLLYAVAVSDTGLVSPLSILKFEVSGVIEAIEFQDDAMEAQIRKLLNIPGNKTVYSNDLWDITAFTVPADAKNYNELRYMLYLQSLTIENGIPGQLQVLNDSIDSLANTLKILNISNTSLTSDDMDVVSGFISLEYLILDGCGLSTTAQLSQLTKLSKLNLNNNAIRNISALSNMPELKELYMQRNALIDLTSIASCSQLEILDISYNAITSLESIAALERLKALNIGQNEIQNISALSQFKDLEILSANDNQIIDISALESCSKLTIVDISGNRIESLEPLASHINITNLNFAHNQVSTLPNWDHISAFVTIDGSYNLLSDLTPLGKLQNINNILMDYNENIQSVEALAGCPVLIQVNVYGTKVTDVKMLTEQSIIVNYNPIETAE